MTYRPPFVLLDNGLDDAGTSYLFGNPLRILQANEINEVESVLKELDSELAAGNAVAGFLSYEAGYALEPRLAPLMPAEKDAPLAWLGVFSSYKKLSGPEVASWLENRPGGDYALIRPECSWDKAAYAAAFEKLKNYIAAGDIYQLNLTFAKKYDFFGDAFSYYAALRRRQPVAYGAFIGGDDFDLLSISPELFFSLDDNRIETRPMKGTAPRGASKEEDYRLSRNLARDEKSRAENLMIVDLMRNDVGRIAKPASVSVPQLFHVDAYPTLHQMISTVEAERRKDATAADILRALFPPGSVTGAPKIRAIEIGRELEPFPRGVYTGAVGAFFSPEKAVFNVAIRTLWGRSDGMRTRFRLGIGSGVVQDSVMDMEYDECLLKSAFADADEENFYLFETLRHDKNKGFFLLDRHLARLKASATFFGIAVDDGSVRDVLNAAVAKADAPYMRVKLSLSESGALDAVAVPFSAELIGKPLSFSIADERVDSRNPLLFHKTTRRAFLDKACQKAKRRTGCDETLFLNERGELTQGSYTNIFVKRNADGLWLTPPLDCGLLPGTLRADLLESGKAVEQILFPQDLATAQSLALGNSLRGLAKSAFVSPK